MKTSTVMCVALYVLVLVRNSVVVGQDRWAPDYGARTAPAGYAVPQRGLLGLPMPQQWSGTRPASVRRYGQYEGLSSVNPNCPNGNCGTALSANGQLSRGQGITGQCVGGQCATGSCATGNCMTGQCRSGQSATGGMGTSRCPGGVCPQGANGGWTTRDARMLPADPFRRSGLATDEQWSQVRRPDYGQMNNTLRSSNDRRNDLNLRSEYFGNEYGDDMTDRFNRLPLREGSARQPWSRSLPARSLEAPVERSSGMARI